MLGKGNKLALPVLGSDAKTSLKDIRNHGHQISTMQRHLVEYGLVAGTTIVDPVDVRNAPDLAEGTFNVFDDYRTLHPAQVANSNAWYHYWSGSAIIVENLSLQMTFLHNNCTEELWNKCLAE